MPVEVKVLYFKAKQFPKINVVLHRDNAKFSATVHASSKENYSDFQWEIRVNRRNLKIEGLLLKSEEMMQEYEETVRDAEEDGKDLTLEKLTATAAELTDSLNSLRTCIDKKREQIKGMEKMLETVQK